MPTVTVQLPVDGSADDAIEIASAIRDAGTLTFTNVEGNTVNVQVGDVTVDA
jgi:hypothetical protein